MISTSPMRPLPVRPIDGLPNGAAMAPARSGGTHFVKHPTDMTSPGGPATELVDSIRTAAYERMLDRLGIKDTMPLADPTA